MARAPWLNVWRDEKTQLTYAEVDRLFDAWYGIPGLLSLAREQGIDIIVMTVVRPVDRSE